MLHEEEIGVEQLLGKTARKLPYPPSGSEPGIEQVDGWGRDSTLIGQSLSILWRTTRQEIGGYARLGVGKGQAVHDLEVGHQGTRQPLDLLQK